MSYLSNKEAWAFTFEAELAITELSKRGLDRDLAVEVLHLVWAEEEIYELHP